MEATPKERWFKHRMLVRMCVQSGSVCTMRPVMWRQTSPQGLTHSHTHSAKFNLHTMEIKRSTGS